MSELSDRLRRLSQQSETEAEEFRQEGYPEDALRAEGASSAFLWAANVVERQGART